MRLWIYAIGHMRGTPEGQLCEDFCDRARKMGRNRGFTAVALEELPVSKHRDVAARMKDEAERLAARLCVSCGEPAQPDRSRCTLCLERERKRSASPNTEPVRKFAGARLVRLMS